MSVPFFDRCQALVLKHAHAYVRAKPLLTSVQDIYREAELILETMHARNDQAFEGIASPDGWVRSLVQHAAGRGRRRRKLVEQVAAGDDLEAVAEEHLRLDEDIPVLPKELTKSSRGAQERLDGIKKKLTAPEALVFALLIEDDLPVGDVAELLSRRPGEIGQTLEKILEAAKESPTGDPMSPDQTLNTGLRRTSPELTLRYLGTQASCTTPSGDHQDEALLSLIRSGDLSEDLSDAVGHVAHCPECRARLTEGELSERHLVIVALEGPRSAGREVYQTAEAGAGRVIERGEGRWLIAAPADRSAAITEFLEHHSGGSLSRHAMSDPFVVPTELQFLGRRGTSPVGNEATLHGIDAAETRAWAAVSRVTPRRNSAFSWTWAFFAAVAIAAAVVAGYFLAAR